MSALEDLFPVPTDGDRDARRTDLLRRARLVQAHGWDDYLYTWSTGEVLAVALLLDDYQVLSEFGETRDGVLSRWAYDLYGGHEARADTASGFPATTAWFAATATQLTTTHGDQ
ncbi:MULTISPECIES: hypothetical protein [Nocardia]|uniref:hypothetical protein n=1 Tax=Nocardia TaxID=1817 RepID=UPI002457FB42|nr:MULTISPECIES: hypothetical protein [Nocardia]